MPIEKTIPQIKKKRYMNNYKEMTDEQLAVMYMNGDAKAFDEILLRYKNDLFAYFLYMVGNEEEADELFQETFIKAIINIQKGVYKPDGVFRYWIMRIAHNIASDKTRKLGTRILKDANRYNDLSLLDCDEMRVDSHESEIIRDQTFKELYDLVDRLPAKQRELVYLHYFEDLKFREISEITGMSINTALGRVRYALQNLRRMIKTQRSLSD